MIRAIVDNAQGLTPDMLPPARPDGSRGPREGERLRVLFIQANDLGARSTSRLFERFATSRDDFDSVHVNLQTRGLMRLAGAQGYLQGRRMAEAWSWVMSRWIRGPLKLDRFDVILVMRQQRALALARARRRLGDRMPPFLVDIDATTASSRRDFGIRHDWPDLDIGIGHTVFSQASGIGSHSHWGADSLRDDYGVDPKKVYIYVPCVPVPHMAEAARVRAQRRAQIAAGATDARLRLVFVGHDWERKGGHRLLRWHQERWKDRVELHICSGKAPRDDRATNVFWHGAVPNDRLVKEVLPTMDLFVMPTVNDTSPIAIQEAASCGLPQISSRLAGIPELIDHGVTGFVCPPRDDVAFIAAIERLINDPALLQQMSEASARRVTRELSSERWLGHLADNLYAAAAGRPMILEPEGITMRPRVEAPAASTPAL